MDYKYIEQLMDRYWELKKYAYDIWVMKGSASVFPAEAVTCASGQV